MADALHKRHSDKSKQINRNERYGAVKQQKVASISSAKQKARNYAARDEKRTRVLAKQAILRELTGDSDLLIKAHGLQLKQREEKDSSEENPYGHPLSEWIISIYHRRCLWLVDYYLCHSSHFHCLAGNRPLHGFRRHLGCGAVAAKITANVWKILQLSTLITPQLHVQF